jgi:hypothetical protein
MSRRVLFWAAGFVLIVAILVSASLRSLTPGGTALDNTGKSAGATPTARRASATPVAEGQPAISGVHQPFLLLIPGLVRPGSNVGVMGSNFDPKAIIDFVLKQHPTDRGYRLMLTQTDKNGSFGSVVLTLPDTLSAGTFIIEARQRHSDHVAQAVGVLDSGLAAVTLGTQVGRTGDVVGISAKGFVPSEKIRVYWNSVGTTPLATFQSDSDGNVSDASLAVPFGAVGNNVFIFIGDKSKDPVAVPFLLLSLYPSVQLSSYAIQANNLLSFSGQDFGPNEPVAVYVNTLNGPPVLTIQTNDQGAFAGVPGFVIPFGLKGTQTVIFIGQRSRTPATATFTVLPYTPTAVPSAYGASPGTTLTFYAAGFARNEVVHVYMSPSSDTPGTLVSCFTTNGQGAAGAAGSYLIPGNTQPGKLLFTLVGKNSGASALATVDVMPVEAPVQTAPQAPFSCPLDGR